MHQNFQWMNFQWCQSTSKNRSSIWLRYKHLTGFLIISSEFPRMLTDFLKCGSDWLPEISWNGFCFPKPPKDLLEILECVPYGMSSLNIYRNLLIVTISECWWVLLSSFEPLWTLESLGRPPKPRHSISLNELSFELRFSILQWPIKCKFLWALDEPY